MPLDDTRLDATNQYADALFGQTRPQFDVARDLANAAGMPDIAIDGQVGALIRMLARSINATNAIEIGTLSGYSGLWILDGLTKDGRLITVELDPDHARVARSAFEQAGVSDRVELRQQGGLEALHELNRSLQPGSVDLVFLDANKADYPDFFEAARPLIRPGGILIADNALGSIEWWITDPPGHPARDAVDTLNRRISADPEFDGLLIPIRQGVLVARRTDND